MYALDSGLNPPGLSLGPPSRTAASGPLTVSAARMLLIIGFCSLHMYLFAHRSVRALALQWETYEYSDAHASTLSSVSTVGWAISHTFACSHMVHHRTHLPPS
jgi:hypothetical protein